MNCKILLRIDKKNIPEQSKSKENVKIIKMLQDTQNVTTIWVHKIGVYKRNRKKNINKKVIYKKKK